MCFFSLLHVHFFFFLKKKHKHLYAALCVGVCARVRRAAFFHRFLASWLRTVAKAAAAAAATAVAPRDR